MISYYTLLTIAFCHWLFDFKLQTRNMANDKSRSVTALTQHVCVYTIGLVVMSMLNIKMFANIHVYTAWVILNCLLHALTDAVTSRLTSFFYKNGDQHNFFATIGIDQYIHYATLFGTLIYFTSL